MITQRHALPKNAPPKGALDFYPGPGQCNRGPKRNNSVAFCYRILLLFDPDGDLPVMAVSEQLLWAGIIAGAHASIRAYGPVNRVSY